MNHKLESRLLRNAGIHRRYADDTTLMAENEEELNNLFRRMKEPREKAGLKFNIQKMGIMASCPITSWQTEGGKVEAVTDFIFLVFKITADDDCHHETKRHLLAPCKENYEKPRLNIKKQRHHFANKGPYNQSYGFSSSHMKV